MAEIEIPSFSTSRRRTRTYDKENANTSEVLTAMMSLLVPVGTFIPSLLSEQPDSDAWKICNGQSLLKQAYPRLYDVIGGKFGETSIHFNLPDLRGRFVMGAPDGQALGDMAGTSEVNLTVDQMPRHSHTFTGDPHTHDIDDPGHSHNAAEVSNDSAEAFSSSPEAGAYSGNSGQSETGISIQEATVGGTIGQAGGNKPIDITPPFMGVNWLVRT